MAETYPGPWRGALRRLPWESGVDLVLPLGVVLFSFASSSVPTLLRIGRPGRWVVLFVLAGLALGQLVARGRLPRALPAPWIAAALLVCLGVDSALWSVDPHATVGRIFTVGVVFAAGAALGLGAADPREAVVRVLRGVLAGITAVALLSLVVLVASHHHAVVSATAGAGWRFQGIGENPNTVPMLLAAGLPLAVWWTLDRSRLVGLALVLLFVGELAASDSRGGTFSAFAGAILTALVLGRSRAGKLAAAAALVVLAVICVELGKLPKPLPPVTTPPARTPAPKTRGIDAQTTFRLEDEIGFPPLGAYRPPVHRTVFGSSGRGQAWNGALHQGTKRPVAGYGFGTEQQVFVDRYYSFQSGFVENTYLGLFLQIGAAGLALFVALLLALAWSALRLIRRAPPPVAGPGGAAAGVLLAAVLIGMSQSGLLNVGNIAAASFWFCVLPLPLLAAKTSA